MADGGSGAGGDISGRAGGDTQARGDVVVVVVAGSGGGGVVSGGSGVGSDDAVVSGAAPMQTDRRGGGCGQTRPAVGPVRQRMMGRLLFGKAVLSPLPRPLPLPARR